MVDISEQQGLDAVKAAKAWVGTKYKMIGGASKNQIYADCSGSMAGVFNDIGLPFKYFSTKQTGSEEFKKYYRQLTADDAPRAGDIVIWPDYHEVMYDPNASAKDPWGHPADAWGAFGAHVRMGGVEKNVAFGPTAVKHTLKKHKHSYYRRQVDDSDVDIPTIKLQCIKCH